MRDEVVGGRLHRAHRRRAVGDAIHLVALDRQHVGDELAVEVEIVGDEDAGTPGAGRWARTVALRGRGGGIGRRALPRQVSKPRRCGSQAVCGGKAFVGRDRALRTPRRAGRCPTDRRGARNGRPTTASAARSISRARLVPTSSMRSRSSASKARGAGSATMRTPCASPPATRTATPSHPSSQISGPMLRVTGPTASSTRRPNALPSAATSSRSVSPALLRRTARSSANDQKKAERARNARRAKLVDRATASRVSSSLFARAALPAPAVKIGGPSLPTRLAISRSNRRDPNHWS